MASSAIREAIAAAVSDYKKPEGKVFEYGTAGVSFLLRGCSTHIDSIILEQFRMKS